jgi:hypothetical protein
LEEDVWRSGFWKRYGFLKKLAVCYAALLKKHGLVSNPNTLLMFIDHPNSTLEVLTFDKALWRSLRTSSKTLFQSNLLGILRSNTLLMCNLDLVISY